MGLDTLVKALLRGSGGSERSLEATRRGALYVAHDLPNYAELVNLGVCWKALQPTAVAAVTALPTVTAGLSIYNGNAEGGASLIIFGVFAVQVANAAAQASWGIAGCVQNDKAATLPTQDIAKASVKGLKARQGLYGGGAILDEGATVTDDFWEPLGDSVNTAVVSLGGTMKDVALYPARILPPGGMMSTKGIASAIDITLRLGFRWAELDLN